MKGLVNLGNSCYFNSVLQCLLQVPQLSNYFIIKPYEGNCEFIKEYKNFVKNFWLNKNNTIENPVKLLKYFKEKNPDFDNPQQQDCQETLFLLLDMFEKDIIEKIFYFDLIQETICKSEKSIYYEHTNIFMMYPQESGKTLHELITHNQQWNTLEDYKDSKNIVHNIATTRTMFWTPPRILVFSLKMYNNKIKSKIDEIFDLNPYIHENSKFKNKDNQYYLFGMCSHMGSINGGHYISYTKHKEKWYIKDDESCNEVKNLKLEDHYYIIFYKKL